MVRRKSCSFGFMWLSFVNFFLICMCASFPFGFEGWMIDVIVLVPDFCLSIYLTLTFVLSVTTFVKHFIS